MSSPKMARIRQKFLSRCRDTQIEVLRKGRPRPPLPRFRFLVDLERATGSSQPFHPSQYDRTPWLTACEKLNLIFCWPCLLLVEKNTWNTAGFCSPFYLPQLQAHERQLYHLKASLKLKQLMDLYVPPWKDELIPLQDHAGRNRELLRRIIDGVNFVVLQRRLSRRRHVDPITPEECVQAINFLSRHCTNRQDPTIVEDAAFLLGNDNSFLKNVVAAISNVLQFAIKKEAHGSPFVSVILTGHRWDDTSGILRSTVLRFVRDGKVRERFVGFCRGRNVVLFKDLSQIVFHYQLDKKLVGVAVDGLCLYEAKWLNQIIHSKCPGAKLVHCYFHRYWDVMLQSLTFCHSVKFFERQSFFNIMESMVSFLKEHFDDVERHLAPNTRPHAATYDYLRSEDAEAKNPVVLDWIKSSQKELIEYFNCSGIAGKWKENDLIRVRTFGTSLSEFDTVFWLLFFLRLFNILRDVQETLYSPNPEDVFEPTVLPRALDLVNEDKFFNEFWSSVQSYFNADAIHRLTQCRAEYCKRASAVLSWVSRQTSDRLDQLRTLTFFNLLSPSYFYPVPKDQERPMTYLIIWYGSIFTKAALEKEILDLFKNNRLLGFSKEQMLEYMTSDESRCKRFPNMIRLAELVLSLPCVKPSDPRPPVIHRVKAFASSLNLTDSPDFSVLFVENELLEKIRLEKNFYDDVISVLNQIINKETGGMVLS